MSSKLRVGLDLDGVLVDFSKHFLEYLRLPTHPSDDWNDPRFRENFNRVTDDHRFWLTAPPIIHGRELTFNPTMYVTARPIPTYVSMKWLMDHDFPYAPVITVGTGGSKVAPLKDQVDIFLDDSYSNYKELNKEGINCKLITRDHNLKYDVGEDRVRSLRIWQQENEEYL